MRRRLGVLAVCCAALAAPAPAFAIPSVDAIARINALRVANGIPALVEDPALTAGCQAHARYMALNRGWDTGRPHDETPGRPGYTPEGADAAHHSVLGGPTGWTNPHPWATAPIHRAQVMDPELVRTGYGEQAGWMCLRTIAEPTRAVAGQIFSFPGPGATGVPTSETARELNARGVSSVPGDSVGLPAGTQTGPNLIVYAPDQVSVDYVAARLSGPRGPVSVAQTSQFVIPRQPLEPSTHYTAEIDLRYQAGFCYRQGAPSASPESTMCGADVTPYCESPDVMYDPVWYPVGQPPPVVRQCAPGEPIPPDQTVPVPERVVTHRWSFTTAAGKPGCPRLLAPSRLARRATLVAGVRACAPAPVTAAVYRGATRVLAKRIRVPSAGLTRVPMATRRLAPGRYRLVVTIDGTRLQRAFTVAR